MSLHNDERIELQKPLRLKSRLTILFIAIVIIGSAVFAEFSILDLIFNLDESLSLLGRLFFPPNWSYTTRIISALLETFQMAILGTVFGGIIAIPLSVLAASNFTIKYISVPVRLMLNFFRTIPALVLASLFVAFFDIGSFGGVMALSVFSFGLVSKLTYESIESIDHGQVEALMSLGANKINILRYAIIPQVLPQFMSYILYALEVNVRAAAVLGYVGAGGIGQTYELNLAWRRFDKVGMIIIVSFAFVLIIDFISSSIRKRLV